ncbi:unnamed protein product [Closterium sp. NIES-64]|nr:unnamed protein product [Closterium sp. NIES-65]CAI5980224.1 unnamed protein product [Closterium sp. NIES-64]
MATTTLPSGVGPLATCRQSCHVDSPSCRTASSSVVGRTALRSALGGRALGGSSTAGLRSWRGKSGSGSGGAERLRVRALTEEEVDVEGESIADDYYSILGLTCDATPEEIKRAYYACMKACHPDLSNNHPDSVTFCSFVNEVYEVLSDPEMRLVYDEIKGYSLTSINPFMDTRHEKDQVFVDEFTCIGCKNCANTAEDTFEIEEMWGRARVCNQGGNPPAKIQEAVETCPVSCIHWVTSPQLALLEDEMRRMERVSVAIMQAQSSRGADVFMQANSRWEKRRNKALSKAKAQAARDGKAGKYNKPLWETMGEAMGMGGEKSSWRGDGEGVSDKAASSNPVNQEKVRRAAAAARRWREYSRQGVDRRRKMFLAAESGGSDESAGEEIEEERKEGGGEKVQGKGKGKQAEERDREPVAL